MSIKSLSLFAALGLAGLSLSGCVYDGGPYAYGGPGYYGSGYYAGGAVIYDRGGYYGPRYNRYRPVYNDRYHRNDRYDRYERQRPSTPRPRPVPRPDIVGQVPDGQPVAPTVGERRRGSQGDLIFRAPEGRQRGGN